MSEIIYGTKKELEYLESLSKQKFVDWVKDYLVKGRSEPLSLSAKGTYKSEILLQYYHLSSNSNFRRRFERAILKLVNFWRESIDSLDYLAELLTIAGSIRVDDTYSRLLVLAKNENLKGQLGLGVDLHHRILRVLFGFGMDENRDDLEFIIDRDIKDPRYAPLCFRRSWELEFRKGIDNIPHLLKCYHEDRSIDAESALERFFEKLGLQGFRKEFLNMLQKLSDVYYNDFFKILQSIGIKRSSPVSNEEKEGFFVELEGDEGFIAEWKKEGNIIWIEIPEDFGSELESTLINIYNFYNKEYTWSSLDKLTESLSRKEINW